MGKTKVLEGGAITIIALKTEADRESALELMTGMTREEAFRCNWDNCEKPGTVYLGYRLNHLFCDACAARPELKRFRVRKLRSDVEWWNK